MPLARIATAFVGISIAVAALPAVAGEGFTGIWKPLGNAAVFFGTLDVRPDALAEGQDGQAIYARVRPGGAVFRVLSIRGDAFQTCGNAPPAYVGYRVLEDGKLALILYDGDTPPAEPTADNPLDLMMEVKGSCSIDFFTR
jgi:hypothetical protein